MKRRRIQHSTSKNASGTASGRAEAPQSSGLVPIRLRRAIALVLFILCVQRYGRWMGDRWAAQADEERARSVLGAVWNQQVRFNRLTGRYVGREDRVRILLDEDQGESLHVFATSHPPPAAYFAEFCIRDRCWGIGPDGRLLEAIPSRTLAAPERRLALAPSSAPDTKDAWFDAFQAGETKDEPTAPEAFRDNEADGDAPRTDSAQTNALDGPSTAAFTLPPSSGKPTTHEAGGRP